MVNGTHDSYGIHNIYDYSFIQRILIFRILFFYVNYRNGQLESCMLCSLFMVHGLRHRIIDMFSLDIHAQINNRHIIRNVN